MTMIPNKACLLASLALAAAVPATFAQGEEALIWTEKSDGNSVSLAYGSLDSAKNPVFLLSCFNEMDVVVLNIFSVIEGSHHRAFGGKRDAVGRGRIFDRPQNELDVRRIRRGPA